MYISVVTSKCVTSFVGDPMFEMIADFSNLRRIGVGLVVVVAGILPSSSHGDSVSRIDKNTFSRIHKCSYDDVPFSKARTFYKHKQVFLIFKTA